MNNNFAEEYKMCKAIDAAYQLGQEKGDQAMIEAAQTSMKQFNKMMVQKGETYCTVYRLYAEAQDRGNAYPDLRENIWDRDVKALIDAFREYGINHFTFSSGWTNTVETAWLFLQNGCKLEGMVELYGDPKISFTSGGLEYETVRGYLFSVG
ncbi:MAG: hypothetical protein LUG65_03240 [Clostridiales bacterium]|nr:hypothetical protein [Clostridiales bacterium]